MNLNPTNILVAILSSLSAFLFYGYIDLKNEVEVVNTELQQARTELDDVWSHINKGQEDKVLFIEKFYQELEKKKDK